MQHIISGQPAGYSGIDTQQYQVKLNEFKNNSRAERRGGNGPIHGQLNVVPGVPVTGNGIVKYGQVTNPKTKTQMHFWMY